MNKKNVLTAFGIILSFAIAVGGWLATSWLIDVESYRLLSGTRSFVVAIPTIETTSTNDTSGEPNITLGLTENEIVSILQNWEETDNRRPHEPAAGQIDMEQAILVGRLGLEFLIVQNILPAEMLRSGSTRAVLSQNVPQGGQFLPLRYSYWVVHFNNDDIDAVMTINAVTGQVWSIEIPARQPSSATLIPVHSMLFSMAYDDIEDILATFLLNAGIHSSGEFAQVMGVLPPEPTDLFGDDTVISLTANEIFVARQSFANGSAGAIITATGGASYNETLYFTGLNIQLSANFMP